MEEMEVRNKEKLFMGIDTSNYTTSISLVDTERKPVYEARRLLQVDEGKRGLQQSAAFFQHIKTLPELFEGLAADVKGRLAAVAVSSRPRPVAGSYMPVFQAGTSVAEMISHLYWIPLYYTTHQEGHLAAGINSLKSPFNHQSFIAVHLSGGTTEILNVTQNGADYTISIVGGTLDLQVGQLLDRLGLALGMTFPAGAELEIIARESIGPIPKLSVNLVDTFFNLSGAETEAKRLLTAGASPALLARAAEDVIVRSLAGALVNLLKIRDTQAILFVGGVAQNKYFQAEIGKRLSHYELELFFAKSQYSGDNAYGVANIALDNYLINYR